MASNTGKGYRQGAVTGRTQSKSPNGNFTKRNTVNGQYMDQKQDGTAFKGVRREK